jgi:hypothetical protein
MLNKSNDTPYFLPSAYGRSDWCAEIETEFDRKTKESVIQTHSTLNLDSLAL